MKAKRPVATTRLSKVTPMPTQARASSTTLEDPEMLEGFANAVAFAVLVIVLTLLACAACYGAVLTWL